MFSKMVVFLKHKLFYCFAFPNQNLSSSLAAVRDLKDEKKFQNLKLFGVAFLFPYPAQEMHQKASRTQLRKK